VLISSRATSEVLVSLSNVAELEIKPASLISKSLLHHAVWLIIKLRNKWFNITTNYSAVNRLVINKSRSYSQLVQFLFIVQNIVRALHTQVTLHRAGLLLRWHLISPSKPTQPGQPFVDNEYRGGSQLRYSYTK